MVRASDPPVCGGAAFTNVVWVATEIDPCTSFSRIRLDALSDRMLPRTRLRSIRSTTGPKAWSETDTSEPTINGTCPNEPEATHPRRVDPSGHPPSTLMVWSSNLVTGTETANSDSVTVSRRSQPQSVGVIPAVPESNSKSSAPVKLTGPEPRIRHSPPATVVTPVPPLLRIPAPRIVAVDDPNDVTVPSKSVHSTAPSQSTVRLPERCRHRPTEHPRTDTEPETESRSTGDEPGGHTTCRGPPSMENPRTGPPEAIDSTRPSEGTRSVHGSVDAQAIPPVEAMATSSV